MSALPRRVRLAVSAFALLIVSRAARAEQAPARLDHAAAPTAESVDLTCDPEKPDYLGTVRITLEVKQPTDSLRFHSRTLTIDRAVLTSPSATLKPKAI